MQKTKKVLSEENLIKNNNKILNYTHLQNLQSRVCFAHTVFATPTKLPEK